jgi:tetratricopeptide (TPR) repeat protein
MTATRAPADHSTPGLQGLPALVYAVAIVATMGAAIGTQIARDRMYGQRERDTERILYVRSGEAARRITLDFDALAADVYWIRAIQHYGGDRLLAARSGKYELLYPLLDLTTTLDPYFTIAYRFGAIFLSEPAPGGPGRPDQAIQLLQKGLIAQPHKWQYFHDIAFVHYWHLREFKTAAEWFQRAADQPNSPNWLRPLAAGMLTAGNDRASARLLWSQILSSDQEWLRKTAARSLQQLDALDLIDQLQAVVRRFPPAPGAPYSWDDYLRRGIFRMVPFDPTDTPLDIDPASGTITVSKSSRLYPMPSLPS